MYEIEVILVVRMPMSGKIQQSERAPFIQEQAVTRHKIIRAVRCNKILDEAQINSTLLRQKGRRMEADCTREARAI